MRFPILSRIAVVALTAGMLTACTQDPYGSVGLNKQTGGGVLGAVGGAVAGSQFGKGRGQLAAVAVGTLLGGFVGSEIGKSLDRADMAYANQSAQYAFNSGQAASWQNPESGNSGVITPVRSYQSNSGSYCREFQQTVSIGGKSERAFGTACRQPDGSWQIVS